MGKDWQAPSFPTLPLSPEPDLSPESPPLSRRRPHSTRCSVKPRNPYRVNSLQKRRFYGRFLLIPCSAPWEGLFERGALEAVLKPNVLGGGEVLAGTGVELERMMKRSPDHSRHSLDGKDAQTRAERRNA